MYLIKNLIRSVIFISTLLLIGCATTFGIATEKWDKLDANQKKVVMDNYYKEEAA